MRLTNLFHHDAARRELLVKGGTGEQRQRQRTDYGMDTAAVVVALDEDSDGNGCGDTQGTAGGAPPTTSSSSHRLYTGVDEDEGSAGGGGVMDIAPQTQALTKTKPLQLELEALEQELLDDDALYFPPALVGEGEDAPLKAERSGTDAEPAAQRRSKPREARYVPGQQLVPPGLTRYRVDVQYQGTDFDGWFKSTSRRWEVLERRPDGTTRRRPATPEMLGPTAGGGVAGEAMQAKHHARTVLEEALAVAVDVPSVSVVSSVTPETGVSVRRLTCHVDLPSAVEMQPRTILQRATLWLQSRGQPLALLACHPCRNQDFHARHSGVRRVYCYRILNRVAPPLFDAGLQWHVDRQLDVARMQRFAAAMEGTHDFGYFADPKMGNALRRAAASGGGGLRSSPAFEPEHEEPTIAGRPPWEKPPAPKAVIERGLSHLDRAAALPTFNEYGQRVLSYDAKPKEYLKARTNLPTVRTVERVNVVRQEDEVLIWFVGQSFLRHQIRNMVSVLKASGHGLWDEQELRHAMNAGFEVSRKKYKRERLPPAPAYGLTLWDVEYPRQHREDYVPFVDSGPFEEVDLSAIN